MNIKHINTVLEKGSGILNEDAIHVDGELFGVFDGATSLDKSTFRDNITGGYIASSTACRTFSINGCSLEKLAYKANLAIRREMLSCGINIDQREKLWSTSAAVARIKTPCEEERQKDTNPMLMEWLQTGDAFILLILEDGSHRLLGKNHDHDYETLSMWKNITGSHNDILISDALDQQIKKVRMGMNRTYGVLNGEDAAEKFITSGMQSLEGVEHILIFTDGLAIPSSEPSKHKNFDTLVKEYLSRGLEGLKNHIRKIERQDPQCRQYPRFKCHDDIAAVAIELS
ncbi:protein phosphatase 2C domain-containing protein [Desulfamplus magnetovallimortis]|nr:protein phosphatase 2C domain-containing protein [Desulfamplus magnetovallimortis]